MGTAWKQQIANKNFLSPIGFKFVLAKYPKVAYLSQSANIPSINLGILEQPTMLGRSIPTDGNITYDPFNLQFIVDEDIENYLILHNWIRGLGAPDNLKERRAFIDAQSNLTVGNSGMETRYADATLTVLNSNFKSNFQVVFYDIIPTNLSALDFNATVDGSDYAAASVTFQYRSYEIQKLEGARNTKLT